VLRIALNRAVKWHVVARNVATLADPPRGPRAEIQPLTQQAAEKFQVAAADHRLRHLFTFMLCTGVRVGEALALRWQDVNLDERRITVRHTLEHLTGQPWRLTEPKSESGRRTIPLAAPALAALRAQEPWYGRCACALAPPGTTSTSSSPAP